MPQLKVLSLSSWLTPPAEESHLKTGGKLQEDKSIFIPCPLDKALKMVDVAKKCGVDAIKLQTYTPDTMTINSNGKKFVISDKKNLFSEFSKINFFSPLNNI